MPRISQLPALTVPEANDEIAIVDASAATTKKITRADLLKGADLPNDTVTTAAIADNAVTADKIDWGTVEYSTTETVIGKWIDGRTIYRKVIDIGALPNNSQKLIAHGVSGIYELTKLYGIATSTTTSLPLPYVNDGSDNNRIVLLRRNTNIDVTTYTNRTAFTGYVIMEYTKT